MGQRHQSWGEMIRLTNSGEMIKWWWLKPCYSYAICGSNPYLRLKFTQLHLTHPTVETAPERVFLILFTYCRCTYTVEVHIKRSRFSAGADNWVTPEICVRFELPWRGLHCVCVCVCVTGSWDKKKNGASFFFSSWKVTMQKRDVHRTPHTSHEEASKKPPHSSLQSSQHVSISWFLPATFHHYTQYLQFLQKEGEVTEWRRS